MKKNKPRSLQKEMRQIRHIEEGITNSMPDKEKEKRYKALGEWNIKKQVKVKAKVKKGDKKRAPAKKAEAKKAFLRSGATGGRKARR